METMEAHVGKMEAQLRHWGVKLDEFNATVQGIGVETNTDYRVSIRELRARHKVVQARLAELRAAGSERWETFKEGVEKAWTDLDGAFKRLTAAHARG